jgi:hypothetical protein
VDCPGENLYDVLTVMKSLKLRHNLWIDALCINQNDKNERSAQVSIMGDIYSSADEVIVWLGPHDASSRLTVAVMERIRLAYESVNSEQRPKGSFGFGDPVLFSKIGTAPITMNEWLAVTDFFARRWFHRIWITQEVALSRNLRFLCGDSVIPRDTITGFAKWVCNLNWDQELDDIRRDKIDHPVCGIDAFSHTTRLIFVMKTGLKNSETAALLKTLFGASTQKELFVGFVALMLIQNQHRLATDPRDKVFAPLALAKMVTNDEQLSRDLPPVDYGKTVRCVYSDITAYIIRSLGNLSILSFVDASKTGALELPSWTPNFSVAYDHKQISELGFNAILPWNCPSCKLAGNHF